MIFAPLFISFMTLPPPETEPQQCLVHAGSPAPGPCQVANRYRCKGGTCALRVSLILSQVLGIEFRGTQVTDVGENHATAVGREAPGDTSLHEKGVGALPPPTPPPPPP